MRYCLQHTKTYQLQNKANSKIEISAYKTFIIFLKIIFKYQKIPFFFRCTIRPYIQVKATLVAVVGLTDHYLRPIPC